MSWRLKIIILCFKITWLTAENTPCPVYITLSPKSQLTADSQLIINWGPGCQNPPDWIGLYNVNPSISEEKPLAFEPTNCIDGGAIQTNIKLGNAFTNDVHHFYDQLIGKLPASYNKETAVSTFCSTFFIAGYKHDDIQALNCLKFSPGYLTRNLLAIQNVPLKNLFIPGTHCSGCYMTKSNRRNTVLQKVGFTQNFDVAMQLLLGIRYLDFSIGYLPSHQGSDRFWIMNDSLRIQKLLPILDIIKRFVSVFREVVILDFRMFPLGFYNHNDRHFELLELINGQFGELIVQKIEKGDDASHELTVVNMKKRNQYILIFYNNELVYKDSLAVWKPWQKYSSEYIRVTDLAEYMRNLFSIKSTMRPQNVGWILHGIQSIESSYEPNQNILSSQERAESINGRLNRLIGGPWGLNANIFAIDYFMSTNLVDIAHHINMFKHMESANNNNLTFIEI